MGFHRLIATWFGCGLLPKMPGTYASLGAFPLIFAASHFCSLPCQLYLIGALLLLGTYVSYALLKQNPNLKDPSYIVIDEVVGQWIAVVLAPPLMYPVGFLIFRILDIWKPWPISWADKLPGATGIMLDDVLAGITTAFLLWCLSFC